MVGIINDNYLSTCQQMERTGDLAIILGKIESMRSEMVSISSDVQNIREDVNYIKEAQRKGDAKMDEFHALLNKVKELIENNRPSSAEILSSGVQQQDYCESPNVSDGQYELLPKQQQKQVQQIAGRQLRQQEHSSWFPQQKSQKVGKFPLRREETSRKDKSKIGRSKRQQIKISFEDNDQMQYLGEKIEQNHIPIFHIADEEVLPRDVQGKLAKVFERMNLKLTTCERVYSYPAMSHINFHQKIDKKGNLLILIEMCNNHTIGAFTELCFDPKPNYIPKSNPKSFLCNLSEQRFLFASRINKTHSYDKNYLIFGNWEIKIKTGEKFLQSSLGKKGSCFAKSEYDGEGLVEKDVRRWLFGEIINDSEDKRLEFKSYSIFIFQ